jgi:hypothetical protein
VAALSAAALSAACDRGNRGKPPTESAPPAPSIPWQPHGLREPTVRCTLDVPAGLRRLPSPMPDHIAELMSDPPATTVIVAQRVEPDLESARQRVNAYHRSGLLTAEGARTLMDTALTGAHAPAHLVSVRSGPPNAGRVEAVALLAFERLPLVEVVARYDEGDARAADSVLAVVRALRCEAP